MTRGGTVLLAVPGDAKLYRVETTDRGAAADDVKEESLGVGKQDEVEVSSVGEDAVVLDRTTSSLRLPGGDTVEVADGAEARLQQPSADSDVVVIATTTGLVRQPLSGGTAEVRRAEGSPAQPVQLGGCTYGVWSSTAQIVRDCEGTDNDVNKRLEGVDASSVLAYRVNRNVIVLNDLAAGTLWMASDEYEKVDDWDLKIPEDAEGEKQESEETTPEQVDQFIADRQLPNRPPQPADDEVGVRPGRTTILNVLSNDVDPDGDVMTASVEQAPEGEIGVNQVLGGAALQAVVPANASGGTSFTYTVADGRGGTADATVNLKVVPLTENEPPAQTGEPVLKVAQGGVASIRLLPYFRDPDGDDLILQSAAASIAGDEVRSRADGTVEFRDGGSTTGRKIVTLSVADGLGAVAEGRLLVDVVATQEPPIAVSDHVVVLADQPVTVTPLRNDRDPNGDSLRLVNVSEAAGAVITANYPAGSFRFVSDSPGSYDITYTVSDGPNATMGLVRVDVLVPPDEAGPPVAVSDQVLLPTGGSALVDVLANDTDPAGGVLVVRSVQVPEGSGVNVAVLAHQVLRVTEVQHLNGPVTIEYTVSNGAQNAVGQVRIIPIQPASKLRPPEAAPDEVTVHVGDVVTIPVLKNDSHPDGLELTLDDELVESPDAVVGEAFVSEDAVRFRAGRTAGTAYAVYEVADPNGQKDSAQVTIRVVDGKENAAPQLPDVDARVLTGGTVRITLPLEGADPDGDYVMLGSISSAPTKGTVRIDEGYLDYTASASASGSDSFTYTAVDTRGAIAEGTVRVGIAVPPDVNQSPVTMDDQTLVRPGRTVAIDALANDSDPDGDQIGLLENSFEGENTMDAQVADDRVVVTAPGDEGSYSFYYGIQDAFSARGTGAITVDVAADAPLLRPVARDDIVSLDDIETGSVTVDVLRNDSDPDGVPADLELAVEPGNASVTEDGEVTVALTDEPQIVEYTVTDIDGLEATAFVRVPGDPSRMGPHLRPDLQPLDAISGQPLDIDITQYVVVAEGRTPRLTEESEVKATEGDHQVTGPTTIVYTSREDYAGAASVSFEVTDGSGPDDGEARTSVLTLPINVVPAENMPPAIVGTPTLEVAAGEESAVDLSRFVTDPEQDPLKFQVTGGAEGVTTSLEGTRLDAQANADVPKGTTVELPFTVTDDENPPVSGTITLTVVGSTRPLARANDDVVDGAHQGEETRVDVTANDSNPFPETPLELTGGKPIIETGSGTAEYSGDQVSITPADSFVGVMVVRYRVQDATKDPDREVDGRIQVTVLGKPEAPAKPRVEEVRSHTVVLSWDPPNNNGAEITGYTVRSNNGYSKECATTTCTLDGLTNDVVYTFTVSATNEVDEGPASPPSDEVRPDAKPDQPQPPTLTFGDQSLTVTWVNKTYTDRSPIECVNLEISPAPVDGRIEKTCVAGNQVVWQGLRNGTAYTVRVQAVNRAPDPSDWSVPSAPETPAGPPAQPAAPTAERTPTALDSGGQITVRWTTPANNGDAVHYYNLDVLKNGSKVDSVTNISGTSQVIQNLDTNASYTFTVVAHNKAGDSPASGQSNAVVPYGTPDTPGAPRAAHTNAADRTATVTWSPVATFRGPGGYYQMSVNGGAWGNASSPATYTMTYGTRYTFRVRACNQYTCSAASGASNELYPYTTPGVPGVTWVKDSATDGHFTMRGPGDDGGNAVTRIEWEFTRGTSGNGSSNSWPFDVGVPAGYDQTFTLRARACNAAGCGSWGSDTGSTDPAPQPRAWVTRGDSAVGQPGCSDPSCAYYRVTTSDFSAGNHSVECWSGTNASTSGWHNIVYSGHSRTYNLPANGTVQLNCYYGYPGTEVGVVIDGVRYYESNARTW
ncbi:Ig-like domain-containing protein [Antribacter sp. KLBMP9083]|uniref:Ig-like domain-containing protein n=1 Tax=Antribacter soli TaxID=2910976 RepID=A0AA41QII6_9MICO|nr:Ig-like domain-containing protein [Antribacter soli]MCF4122832.1 Ig-like domain-containing protein [Antribacter soli]